MKNIMLEWNLLIVPQHTQRTSHSKSDHKDEGIHRIVSMEIQDGNDGRKLVINHILFYKIALLIIR
jgi:hypothetical protein